jgi:hypothetical protein
MKILISGVNPVQCGHRPRLDYVSAVLAIQSGLQLVGHQVELRPVTLGEDLKSYDRVIVFLASMRGFVCVQTLGALWAIYAAANKCTISFDDWQVREAIHGIKAFAAEREKIIEKNPFGYKQIEKVAEYKDKLWIALEWLIGQRWNFPVLIPAYEGGDVKLLSIPESKIFTFNPSILFKGKYGWVEESVLPAKIREWTLAALHDHRNWLKKQNLTWPVKQYGHRKQGQERLPESQIYQKYVQTVGALSPAYKICGSGWWRARYGFAADALCVIAGAPTEMAMVDQDAYSVLPTGVESMTGEDLRALAMFQRLVYYESAGTLDQMQAQIMMSMV